MFRLLLVDCKEYSVNHEVRVKDRSIVDSESVNIRRTHSVNFTGWYIRFLFTYFCVRERNLQFSRVKTFYQSVVSLIS